MKRPRRSMLYIPGNNPAMLVNGGVFGADALLLDLEDAVSVREKDAARHLVRSVIRTVNFGSTEVTVRINGRGTPFFEDDLAAIVPVKPDAIRLPKTECAEDVRELDRMLSELEGRAGVKPGSIEVMPMIETAVGVENAFEIAKASVRVVAITIGGQDLTADMGIQKTRGGNELWYARTRIVMAAKAAGVDALDTVFADVNDEAGLVDETRMVRELGFDGKAVINPRQIVPVHRVFAPAAKEVEQAARIVNAMKEAESRGLGVVSLDGRMIDAPVVRRAQKILELAALYR